MVTPKPLAEKLIFCPQEPLLDHTLWMISFDQITLTVYSWIAKDQKWRVPLFSQNIESLVPFDAFHWADEQAAGTQARNFLFRRAVHVQSFQSPCTCTARRALPTDFIAFDRANQDLKNAFLVSSSKGNKVMIFQSFEVFTNFALFSNRLSLIWAFETQKRHNFKWSYLSFLLS